MISWPRQAHEAQNRVAATQQALGELGCSAPSRPEAQAVGISQSRFVSNAVFDALMVASPKLANSYMQVKLDLDDTTRVSWAGTAHEIREIVARLLRTLAPDDAVKSRPWYEQEKGTSGPTHKQRARHILEQQGAGSKQIEVVEEIQLLEDRIGGLVRATYTRASDAAHRSKERSEVMRILTYFEAFAADLLDL